MIAPWVFYAVLFTAGAAAATQVIDHLCRLTQRPSRLAWITAIGIAVVAPIYLSTRPPRTEDEFVAPSSIPAGVTPVSDAILSASIPARPMQMTRPERSVSRRMDTFILTLWGGASAVMLVGLATAAARTAWRRREWPSVLLDGNSVMVSDRVGPALVGVFRPQIVVPRWVLGMLPHDRELILTHEREHARAADPALLAAAVFGVLCTPWNMGLWYMLRRLRLAIEVDCDRRVLRRHSDMRRYCSLLVEAGERGFYGSPAGTAFTATKSDLRYRVEQMTAATSRPTPLRVAACTSLSVALVVVSCSIPHPSTPLPESSRLNRTYGCGNPNGQPAGAADSSCRGSRPTSGDNSTFAELTGHLRAVRQVLDPASRGASHDTTLGYPTVRDTAQYLELSQLLNAHAQMSRLDAERVRIRDAVQRYFPEMATRAAGVPVGIWFLVDAHGAVVRSKSIARAQYGQSVNGAVIAREFVGVPADSVREVAVLSGASIGASGTWIVWAVLAPGTTP